MVFEFLLNFYLLYKYIYKLMFNIKNVKIMKKFCLFICFTVFTTVSFAQKGTSQIGVDLKYGSENDNIGLGIRGQHNFTDHIRGELAFSYFLKNDFLTNWDISANVHYLFPVSQKITLYPILGLTYTAWNSEFFSEAIDRLGANIGAGAQFDLSSNWCINAEIKYQLVSDLDQVIPSIGVGYKF